MEIAIWAGGYQTGDRVRHQERDATVITPTSPHYTPENRVPIQYDGETGVKYVEPKMLSQLKK